MDKILTFGCKVKPRGVPKIWPKSETGRANLLKLAVCCFLTYISPSNYIRVYIVLD